MKLPAPRKRVIPCIERAAVFLLVVISTSCQPIVVNEGKNSAAKLENIDWKVADFGKLPVPETLGRYDIFFRLRSEGRRMRAFDGCNGIWANYRIAAEQLHFVNVGRTEWTCSRAPEQRDAFMKLLASSARWSVFGERLELYDARDRLLVRFERSAEVNRRNTDKRD